MADTTVTGLLPSPPPSPPPSLTSHPFHKKRIAVIGSGLAGLSVAHLLSKTTIKKASDDGEEMEAFEVHLFERAPSLGMDAASIPRMMARGEFGLARMGKGPLANVTLDQFFATHGGVCTCSFKTLKVSPAFIVLEYVATCMPFGKMSFVSNGIDKVCTRLSAPSTPGSTSTPPSPTSPVTPPTLPVSLSISPPRPTRTPLIT
ncbi:hypothetical protein BC829DRAFT_444840 [Chytridium lagenaria]|nr:hypothetical protein BC829DRAFT_444840 [Chytridium lagenaria]